MTHDHAPRSLRIALVGDFDATVPAHRAIPIALALAASETGTRVEHTWIDTERVRSEHLLHDFDGVWIVPNSPYRNMDGALLAIRFARENDRPFLGTCGGFQHLVIEYVRNVLGEVDAEHAETSPNAKHAVITALECALLQVESRVRLVAGSHLALAYGTSASREEYQCRYGLNRDYRARLEASSLRVAATDDAGDVRALELEEHPFFVGTLFQPERAALRGECPPLVVAYLRACARERTRREALAAESPSERLTPLGAISLRNKLAQFSEHWSPRVIAELNDLQFKLAKFQGEFVWHRHDETDEAFLVVHGAMEIAFRDRSVRLEPGELCVVPRGVEHITRAERECHALILEPRGVVNTGDAKTRPPAKLDQWI